MTKSYPPSELNAEGLSQDPISQFQDWYREAASQGVPMPEAMCLSTVDWNGRPEGRMVLLKEVDDRGFVFYTNLHSPKASALSAHPHASLTFYWEKTRKQIRVSGSVEPVTEAEADAYFASRPHDSQIGAWASVQSQALESREFLEKRFAEIQKKYGGRDVPRPPHWSGYRVLPSQIEFWSEKPYRLHDRFLYSRENPKTDWTVKRLYP